MIPLNSEEIRHIAAESAREAVRELLVTMGVNAHDPDALLEMQRDFAHIRSWRKSVETVRGTVIKTGVTVLVTGLLGALWMIFRGQAH